MRAHRAGYDYSMLGENLAWGSGYWSTPAGTVKQWLGSPAHRRTMLKPRVRELGVGVASGVPTRGVRRGATVAALFGRR